MGFIYEGILVFEDGSSKKIILNELTMKCLKDESLKYIKNLSNVKIKFKGEGDILIKADDDLFNFFDDSDDEYDSDSSNDDEKERTISRFIYIITSKKHPLPTPYSIDEIHCTDTTSVTLNYMINSNDVNVKGISVDNVLTNIVYEIKINNNIIKTECFPCKIYGLLRATKYGIQVRCHIKNNKAICSDWSRIYYIKTKEYIEESIINLPEIKSPTYLQVIGLYPNKIKLKWEHNEGNIHKYNYEYIIKEYSKYSGRVIAYIEDSNEITIDNRFRENLIKPNTRYKFTVSAKYYSSSNMVEDSDNYASYDCNPIEVITPSDNRNSIQNNSVDIPRNVERTTHDIAKESLGLYWEAPMSFFGDIKYEISDINNNNSVIGIIKYLPLQIKNIKNSNIMSQEGIYSIGLRCVLYRNDIQPIYSDYYKKDILVDKDLNRKNFAMMTIGLYNIDDTPLITLQLPRQNNSYNDLIKYSNLNLTNIKQPQFRIIDNKINSIKIITSQNNFNKFITELNRNNIQKIDMHVMEYTPDDDSKSPINGPTPTSDVKVTLSLNSGSESGEITFSKSTSFNKFKSQCLKILNLDPSKSYEFKLSSTGTVFQNEQEYNEWLKGYNPSKIEWCFVNVQLDPPVICKVDVDKQNRQFIGHFMRLKQDIDGEFAFLKYQMQVESVDGYGNSVFKQDYAVSNDSFNKNLDTAYIKIDNIDPKCYNHTFRIRMKAAHGEGQSNYSKWSENHSFFDEIPVVKQEAKRKPKSIPKAVPKQESLPDIETTDPQAIANILAQNTGFQFNDNNDNNDDVLPFHKSKKDDTTSYNDDNYDGLLFPKDNDDNDNGYLFGDTNMNINTNQSKSNSNNNSNDIGSGMLFGSSVDPPKATHNINNNNDNNNDDNDGFLFDNDGSSPKSKHNININTDNNNDNNNDGFLFPQSPMETQSTQQNYDIITNNDNNDDDGFLFGDSDDDVPNSEPFPNDNRGDDLPFQ